uniref:Cellulase n=1 Tax=Thermococcus sp. 2319x1 TaxID=1674923 RepID=UPI00215A0D3F|nr:Chain A, Cellulase [Thermococcus sp. 2319x1]7S8K_B Chain B, Cellulase [Thermococcus sp. 2319x1]
FQGVIKIRYPDDGQWPEAPIDGDGDGNPEFYIEINPWNIQSAEGYAEMTYNLSTGVLHYVQALDDITLKNGGSWVHGYPEIFYGNKPWNNNYATDGEVPLPGKVSNLSNFYLSVSYKLLPKNGLPINFAIESWLTREPWRNSGINSDEQELMIWLYYDGLQPAGSKVKEIIVPIVVNGTPVNATFEVWKANIGWEYIAFRIKTPIKEGTVTIPYGAFISAAANVTSLANYTELYLEDVEVGTEYGTPSTTSAHLEWWFYNVSLEYRPGEPLLSQPPAEGSAP